MQQLYEPSDPDLESRLSAAERLLSTSPDEVLVEELRRIADEARDTDRPTTRVRALRLLARAADAIAEREAVVEAVLREAIGVFGADVDEIAWAQVDLAQRIPDSRSVEAIDLLEEAASSFDDIGDLTNAARALLDVGERYGSAGNRAKARGSFLEARACARSVGASKLVARADDRIAAAEWELGRMDVAERHLRAALAVREAADDATALAWAQYRLGWCLADDVQTDGRAKEALNLLESARSAAASEGRTAMVAMCDEKAAWVLSDRGDYTKAVELLRRALAVFDALGDDDSMQIVQANLAEHLLDLEHFREAEYLLHELVDSERVSKRARVGAASRLAAHLARTGRAEEAIPFLQSHEWMVDTDDRIESTRFALAKASAFNALGLVEATRDAAQTALERLEDAHLPSLQAEALEFLARCARQDGDGGLSESLFGQAVALYLADSDQARALALAQEILPPPPKRSQELRGRPLATGMYL